MAKVQRRIIIAGLIGYLLMLVWVILFHATLQTLNTAFDPIFRSINLSLYFNGRESLLNMLIFVPVGLYFGALFERRRIYKNLTMIAAISLLFEAMQYAFALGSTDIMDLINNSTGGFAGLAICAMARNILKEHFNKVAVIATILITLFSAAVLIFAPI